MCLTVSGHFLNFIFLVAVQHLVIGSYAVSDNHISIEKERRNNRRKAKEQREEGVTEEREDDGLNTQKKQMKE